MDYQITWYTVANSVEYLHIMHAYVHFFCSLDPKVFQVWRKS